MAKKIVAEASTRIHASCDHVWDALVNPQALQQYMFGAQVISDWRKGSSIIWKGEWQGKPYEDHGTILLLEPGHLIQYSHFSPLSGLPDKPENYHTVTVKLNPEGNQTKVDLTQDNNADEDERLHSEKNWEMMLASLKKFIEQPKVLSPGQMPKINPRLERLAKLVGEWNIEAIKGELKQRGHARFDWIERGGFLMEHWDFAPEEMPPAATWIIGSDESSSNFSVLYYDARSVSRVLCMSMEGGTWKMWRDDTQFSQRFTGKFSPDGNTIHVYLEKSFDGVNWMHDFDLVYTRALSSKS